MRAEGVKLTGEYLFSRKRKLVWLAINNEEILRQVIPGCQSLVKENSNEFTAKIRVKLGFFKAEFGGKMLLSEVELEKAYRITGRGTGGLASLAGGSAYVTLEDSEDGKTLLRYQALGHLRGKLAYLGFNLMEDTARRWLTHFFAALESHIADEREADREAAAELPAAAAHMRLPIPIEEPIALHPILWMPLIVFMMAGLLWVFAG